MKILSVSRLILVLSALSFACAGAAPGSPPGHKASAASLSSATTNRASTGKKRLTNAQVWRTQRYEVQMMGDRVGYYRLVRKSDGFQHHEGHPYGPIHQGKLGKVKYYTVPSFRKFIHDQARKERIRLRKARHAGPVAGLGAQAVTPAQTTIGLGWNPSTGYVGAGSVCFDVVTTLNAPISDSSFSVSTGATSFASQTNLTASVSGSYGFFKASGSGTYATNYASTANSGSIFLSAVGLYTATSEWHGLSQIGLQNQQTNTLSANCGTEFMESVTVGGMVSAQIGWGSNSSTASQSIQTAVSADASTGLGSISAAVTAGNSHSSSADNTYYTPESV